ncbi:PLP-dependent aminotransferase family protein [Streptomyces sp. ISL-44]|uniref:aminotransferase-like domain-containing protein n=1 Tax=Streptomyces sp. ISL-44 TaxID=2819184 RepID=UPI001BEB9E72|nr:PLP-dependent aminotransferase family protein [Streptomyces sp. ISL-44]MBT2546736.1 PLP-dependent aminotransferase family protein [Streptomyces sp. ISL-44]
MDRNWTAAELTEILGDWATAPGPLYRRLAAALTVAVEAGDLGAGERLPAERELARALRLSRATIVAAYDLLRDAGTLDSRRGSGSRVRGGPAERGGSGAESGTAVVRRLAAGPGPLISLARAVGEPPADLAAELAALAAEDLPALLADVGHHPRGLPVLRETIADQYTADGLPTTADQIVVTTGATQAISLAITCFVRRRATVVVESPGWPGCLDAFHAAGARLAPVGLDAEGASVAELAPAFAAGPALAYLMPTFHNPTGTLMSAARRRRIAELAAQHGVPVLEDNAYCTTLGTPPPPPLAAYAPRGATVLSVGSVTKTIWSGLRVGWLRAPAPIAERIARLKTLADLGSPVLDQALTARLLRRPTPPDTEPLRRLAHLEAALHARLPDWRWRRPDGGSALWIELPDMDARVYAQLALRHGVEVVPDATHIRVPFTLPTATLTQLAERLCRAWDSR